MKLSVVIPIYNVEKYIKKCVYSLLDNDLSLSDFEIIIVDDESPDSSLLIAQEISKTVPNIKIISQKNKGLGGARNTGIKCAQGDYLLFLDSDDWYLHNTLKKIISFVDNNDVEILEFAAQGITSDGNVAYHISNTTKNQVLSGVTYYNQIRYMNSACNKLYKRSFILENDLFFLEKIYIEDFEFNTRAFLKAKKVMAIDFLVAQFLQSNDSITRNNDESKKDKVVNDFVHIIQITRDLYLQEKSKNNDIIIESYFEERLSFLVATLFYQLIKYKVSFDKIQKIKNELVDKKLFFVNHKIHDKRKDLFRKIMLKNFILFRFSSLFFNFIGS